MITPEIKALFQFIEYLHSNIDNFKQYDEVSNELHLLSKERLQLRPQKNFKDKLKCDEVEAKIKEKFKIIQENIFQPIQTKATELKVCDLNKTETIWNWNIKEISQFKKDFSKDDLPEIFKHKQQYIEYREKTKGESFFGLDFFSNDLDDTLKELFDYFKETDYNEFEAFKTKAIETLPPQPISINESRTKKVICETFNNINEKGWKYAFVSEQDYNLFTDLLTNFFEYKPYTLPETTIQLKRDCKTKVAQALGEIHKELSNINKLSTDTEYFKIIRVLNHFKNKTEGDLYKALTR